MSRRGLHLSLFPKKKKHPAHTCLSLDPNKAASLARELRSEQDPSRSSSPGDDASSASSSEPEAAPAPPLLPVLGLLSRAPLASARWRRRVRRAASTGEAGRRRGRAEDSGLSGLRARV